MIAKEKHMTEYFQMNNAPVQDPGLSWSAKGLLAYFLSLPETWEVHLTDLFRRSVNGKDSTISAMNELIQTGHVVKIQGPNKRRDTQYLVFEDADKGKNYAENQHNIMRVSRMYKDIIKTHIKIQKREKHIPLMLFSMTGGGVSFLWFL